MIILCDMDSVMAALLPEWLRLYNHDYKDTLAVSDITSWGLHEFVKPECGGRIYNYTNKPGFFYSLKPREGAVESLERIHKKGHQIAVVTAVPRGASNGLYDKQRWIKKYFPFLTYKDVIAAHRKELVRGDILLDDGPHNLEDYPGKTCAMDWPYNRHVETDFRVSSWSQFEEVIAELEK